MALPIGISPKTNRILPRRGSRRWATLLCAVYILAFHASISQTTETERIIGLLSEHWRWMNYWFGRTELGERYREGQKVHLLLFWREPDHSLTSNIPPEIGFCSVQLGVCEHYQQIWQVVGSSSEMQLNPTLDEQSSFKEFVHSNFAQRMPDIYPPGVKPGSPYVGKEAKPTVADFKTALASVILPKLEPPDAVREAKVQPKSEIAPLIADLQCLGDHARCRTRLLIPFYGHHDPLVLVFRRCSQRCDVGGDAIVFVRFVDGHWWMGANDVSRTASFVQRAKKQIDRALMLDTGP